jgi:uncharacterized membrane protein
MVGEGLQPGGSTDTGGSQGSVLSGPVTGTVLRPLGVEEQALTPTVVEVTESTWNQARTREQMRSVLAASLVLLLAVVTLLPLLFIALNMVSIDDLDTLLKIVFAPVVALVGSVVGFYFGAEVASREQGGGP